MFFCVNIFWRRRVFIAVLWRDKTSPSLYLTDTGEGSKNYKWEPKVIDTVYKQAGE